MRKLPATIRDVPCLTCQRDYLLVPHSCDDDEHCACDRWRDHAHAARDGVKVSAVVRAALETYVKEEES